MADTIANVDNDALVVASEYLAARQIPTGASDTLYFDAFESRRGGYIGPLTLLSSGGAKQAALAQPAGRMAGLPANIFRPAPSCPLRWLAPLFSGVCPFSYPGLGVRENQRKAQRSKSIFAAQQFPLATELRGR